MPKTKNNHKVPEYVHKTITIRAEQAQLIENRSINLSKFVQKKLDELK